MEQVNRRASVSKGIVNNNLRRRELISGMNRQEKSDNRLVMRRTPPLRVNSEHFECPCNVPKVS